MKLDFLGGWELPHFDLASLRVEGRLLLGLCVIGFVIILYARRNDFRSLLGRPLILFVALLLVTIPLNNILWLNFPNGHVLPPPALPTSPPSPSVPLLGSVSILLAGALFGAGPAMVTGLVAGLVRGGLHSSHVFVPFELAILGLIAGFLLHQTYQGRLWRWLRQPILAGLSGAFWYWIALWVGLFAATQGNALSALDFTQSFLIASIGAALLDGLIGGLIVQALYIAAPGLRPAFAKEVMPPHMRSLNRRLLSVLIPFTMVMAIALLTAVAVGATREATNQAADRLAHMADNAAEMVPFFFTTGQELLERSASNEQLLSQDPEARQQVLAADIQVGVFGPFFSQLILVDQDGIPINTYPESDPPLMLSVEESGLLQRVLNFGSSEQSPVFEIKGKRVISFITPLLDNNNQPMGALVGRSHVSVNPTVNKIILATLEGSEEGNSGFVVDDRGLIAFHPVESYILQPRSIDWDCAQASGIVRRTDDPSEGTACRDLAPDGTQRLIYYYPIEAMGDWTVVATYPFEAVYEQATRIARPTLVILLMITGALVVTIAMLARRLTRPLQALSTAARSMAEGELDEQVIHTGEDEVGQLSSAFERMRLSLKDRLEDLSLLLHVSQVVSSNLDITQGAPAILEAALQATDARFARLILFDEHGTPQVVMPRGDSVGNVTAMDRAVTHLSQNGEPVRIEDIAAANDLVDPDLVGPELQALIAVPLRSQDRDVGILWLGYDHVHQFTDTEVDFISTLTSQTAVAVENARLFHAAESGRRRLAAILESTSDSVIVTDHADRVLLLNRAAAEVFGTDTQTAGGMLITDVMKEKKVVHLLTAPLDDGVPLTDEVPLPDGRTLYASASEIVRDDGQTIGRVAVLRDITYLKELDEMKSDFVATVSHDLRAPLTFMRGYATMIPMAGDVSDKQKRYLDKIMVGVGQMTEMIDGLLDLGRIEAGVGLVSEPCRLDDIIVSQVETMRPQAAARGLTLQLDPSKDVTVVIGDARLLRRVITNLVDNAIKYTPRGGEIKVSWEPRGQRVVISVADSGIGIAQADQVRLFEKFSRIRRRETVDIKGSGLGLAIVKSIVESHGGRVWVESELDQGSTFYVELPLGLYNRPQE